MSFSARLAKLEAKQKQILCCPWCLYHLGSQSDRERKRSQVEPDSFVRFECWDCGTEFSLLMEGRNDYERYAFILILNSRPTKVFIDERVYAAHIWGGLCGSEVKKYEQETNKKLDETRSRNSYPSRSNQTGFSLQAEKAKRDHDDLKRRAFQFLEKRREYYKRIANGLEAFSLDKTLEQIEHDHLITTCYTEDIILDLGFEKYSTDGSELQSKLDACNLHLANLKKRGACEIVIWGNPSSETLEEIGFFEEQKQTAIEDAVEAKRREKEAKLAETKQAETKPAESVLEGKADEREPLQIEQERGPIELASLKPEEIKALLSQVMEERSMTVSSDQSWSYPNGPPKPAESNPRPLRSYYQNPTKPIEGYRRSPP